MVAEIRRAHLTDLTSMLALYRHLSPEDPALASEDAEPVWRSLLASELITVLVADMGGLLIASCVLAIIPNLSRGGRPFALIENVVTHADYRRQGYGTSVLKSALEAGWAAGCYKIMLATSSKKESTLRFYEAAGMTRGGKTFFQARRT